MQTKSGNYSQRLKKVSNLWNRKHCMYNETEKSCTLKKKRWKRSVRANVIKTLHFYVIFVIKYSYYCYI